MLRVFTIASALHLAILNVAFFAVDVVSAGQWRCRPTRLHRATDYCRSRPPKCLRQPHSERGRHLVLDHRPPSDSPAPVAHEESKGELAESPVVQGKVTVDGKPLTSGTVLFGDVDGSDKAQAKVENGVFSIRDLPPGNYRVQIQSADDQQKSNGEENGQ